MTRRLLLLALCSTLLSSLAACSAAPVAGAAADYQEASDSFEKSQQESTQKAQAGFEQGSQLYKGYMATPTPSAAANLEEARAWLDARTKIVSAADKHFADTQLHGSNSEEDFGNKILKTYVMLYEMWAKLARESFVVSENLTGTDLATFHGTGPMDATDYAIANLKFLKDSLDPKSTVYKPNASDELKAQGDQADDRIAELEELRKRSEKAVSGE